MMRWFVSLALSLFSAASGAAPLWQMKPVSIPTRWTASVNPENAWREYPRPQMQRSQWRNLNGLWDYAITADWVDEPEAYEGKILVPFPLESALSGVQRGLEPNQRLWYRRTIEVSAASKGERTLLQFGAVDFEATVYVNGKVVGTHSGGYQSFALDITEALQAGENELVVKAWDPTDKGPNTYGKQRLGAEWAFYTPSSGIWQTVWLEQVPASYIEKLKLDSDIDRSELRVAATLQGTGASADMEAIVRSEGRVVSRNKGRGRLTLKIAAARLWSPDDPYLYDLEVRLLKDGKPVDTVKSYFGMRKVEVKDDDQGMPRLFLNGRYTFHLGLADQGFWPDGLYTAPCDEALKFDLVAAKALGFNSVRKHIKIEPARWYHHADKLGLLVWQDMPIGNNDTALGRAQFEKEIHANLEMLHNSPSIVSWVVFNEGWGIYDQERLAKEVKAADPSRLLNGHSGPYEHVGVNLWIRGTDPAYIPSPFAKPLDFLADFQAAQFKSRWWAGDIADFHWYPGPAMPPAQKGVALVNGEHGSFGVFIEGHVLDDTLPTGRGLGGPSLSPAEFIKRYGESIEQQRKLEAQGLSGSQYFETTDVETEQQGFLTYDRAVLKFPVNEIARLNAKLVPRAGNYEQATAGFKVEIADQRSEAERYVELVKRFKAGERSLDLSRRLALMAARQKDVAIATEAADAHVALSSEPYSRDFWRVVNASTIGSQGKGFALLKARMREANAAAGPQAAEKKLLEIIRSEAIDPYFSHGRTKPDWAELEREVVARFGELGREAVAGTKMMYDVVNKDWHSFGSSYTRYYSTAIPRSAYHLITVTYQVFQHVDDIEALQTAAHAMEWLIARNDEIEFGPYEAVELDTYAGVLYKLGRKEEALEWQQKAVDVAAGRSPEMVRRLERMREGTAAHVDDDGTVHVPASYYPNRPSWMSKTDRH
jgi:hypothetical protein